MCVKRSPKNRNPQLLFPPPRGTGLKLAQFRGKTADMATLHVTPDPLLIGKWDFCVSSQPQIARTPSFETRRDRDEVKTPQDASEKSVLFFDPQDSLTTSVGYPGSARWQHF